MAIVFNQLIYYMRYLHTLIVIFKAAERLTGKFMPEITDTVFLSIKALVFYCPKHPACLVNTPHILITFRLVINTNPMDAG